MHEAQQMVKDFHEAMKLPMPESPTWTEWTEVRIDLIAEELDELQDAWLGKLSDNNVSETAGFDMIAAIDAIADLLYVVYGAAVALGVDIEPFFAEVHRANMKKTGGPKSLNGKQLKPAGWQPPNHEPILREMYGQ